MCCMLPLLARLSVQTLYLWDTCGPSYEKPGSVLPPCASDQSVYLLCLLLVLRRWPCSQLCQVCLEQRGWHLFRVAVRRRRSWRQCREVCGHFGLLWTLSGGVVSKACSPHISQIRSHGCPMIYPRLSAGWRRPSCGNHVLQVSGSGPLSCAARFPMLSGR